MHSRGKTLAVVIAIALFMLGVGYGLFEAQYRVYWAPTARHIIADAGLAHSASITMVSYEPGEKRSAPCSDPGTMAGFVAWLAEATGKRQHKPGGPTPAEQWLVTLDDGRQVRISWWDLSPALESDPRPTITGEVWVGGEQCLLRLPRAGFYRLRERMGVRWS